MFERKQLKVTMEKGKVMVHYLREKGMKVFEGKGYDIFNFYELYCLKN